VSGGTGSLFDLRGKVAIINGQTIAVDGGHTISFH
jgi:hypothetical protein